MPEAPGTRREDSGRRRLEILSVFDEHAKNWEPFLVNRYGERHAGMLLREAREQAEALVPQIPYIGGDENPMTYHLVRSTPSLALYQAMNADGRTARETGRILYDAVVEVVGRLPCSPSKPVSAAFVRRKRKEALRSQERRYPGDWVWCFVLGDGKAFDYGYDFYECGVQKYYRAQGADEFLPYFCALDFVTARGSGQVLMRSMTLAEGGAKCDFRFRSLRDEDDWPPPFRAEPASAPDRI